MNLEQDNIGPFENPNYYHNRELSWLAFNERVLQEALDEGNPLLERFKFLAIFSSNLDEFFMVRVAGLKDQVKAGFNKPENKAGLTPKEQLSKISILNQELVKLQYDTYTAELLPILERENVVFKKVEELTSEQVKFLKQYFEEQIYPVLTPLAIDAYRPFPMLLNKSLNLVIRLYSEEDDIGVQEKKAIVQVPSVLDRFIKLESDLNEQCFILLEDIISSFIHKMFKGFKVKSVSQFRITRNADLTLHEEGARDLLKEIEKELMQRKWGAAVRLEIQQGRMDQKMLNFLLEVLEIQVKDIYAVNGPLDLTFLFDFYKTLSLKMENHIYETLIPQPIKALQNDKNIFSTIKKQDILLHHPYESFEPVIDFVAEAAIDPHVLAIKQTLYRVSGDSPIIEALKNAAEKGKQVTVLVELKARFDEENNVQWAKELEKAGCHVIYGMTSLKTHCKITLVVRKHKHKIERYVHFGTGNYNDQTAKLYTDLGLFTANRKFGVDATNFFNYLSGFTEKPKFHHISVAPFDIRNDFIQLIDREIYYQQKYGNGKIIAKMNSLTDKHLIMKLYEASSLGVKIELIVRGICCLKSGIDGVSDNIRVISIVGRFLEHSRLFYFYHNGEEKIYLSSADMMTRNMEKRVELLFPIFDENIKQELISVINILLRDNVKAREQKSNGSYHYVERDNHDQLCESQLILFNKAYAVSEDEE